MAFLPCVRYYERSLAERERNGDDSRYRTFFAGALGLGVFLVQGDPHFAPLAARTKRRQAWGITVNVGPLFAWVGRSFIDYRVVGGFYRKRRGESEGT